MIRALIVDDEPLARRSVSSLLEGEMDVALIGECASGGEALARIRTDRPDLVFLDVEMPGCDGFEVLEALGCDLPPAVVFSPPMTVTPCAPSRPAPSIIC